MDPKKLAQVASLLLHKNLCHEIVLFVLQLFVVACSVMSRHSLCFFLELCHDSVLLNLSCNCRDMSALCCNISLVPCSLNIRMVCHDIKALLL